MFKKGIYLIITILLFWSLFFNLLLYNKNSYLRNNYRVWLQKEAFNSVVKMHTTLQNITTKDEKKELTNKEAVILFISHSERLLGFNYSGEGVLDKYLNNIDQNKEIVSMIRENLKYIARYIDDRHYRFENYYFELDRIKRINEYIKLAANFLDPSNTISISPKEMCDRSINFNGFIRKLMIGEEFTVE